MNNVSLLLPKNRRPVWTPGLESIDDTLDSELSTYIEIPLLGMITAGNPIECIEDSENIKVPANMVRKDTYALKVSGHSMIDDNIQDGDIIIVEKKLSAENGQSVVA
ncbi:MAG: peptidase, partial [Proteobacteria bacterium]|nr:peptidase [Pseudomonadota bacterium]